ncbi:MAG TPA: HEAT repeat domain-containing protein [Candidatus Acidoferrales bacterium]|nr:HEAT repeat domain-containing protein [Candidatus Acidoferrales bacterium]
MHSAAEPNSVPGSAGSPSPAAPPRQSLSKRWTLAIVVLTLAFVLMPFLFWRATWFGRPLTDVQLADYLNPKSNPHDIQHGLSQVADRIVRSDPTVRKFYPQVIALSSDSDAPIRAMAAWTMGQDNTSPDFHAALLPMLKDPDLTVARNAALALVRFDDTSGHDIIVSMLKAAPVASPAAGTLQTRLKPGQTMNPGTLLARIQTSGSEREVRSQISGTLDRWLLSDGSSVTAGQDIAVVWPSDDAVWESLRALYLIGQPADLDAISPYARGGTGAPPQVAEQARLTMQQIRTRAASSAPSPSPQ